MVDFEVGFWYALCVEYPSPCSNSSNWGNIISLVIVKVALQLHSAIYKLAKLIKKLQ